MDRNEALRALYDAAGTAARLAGQQTANGQTLAASNYASVAKTLADAAQALSNTHDL
jgi:hypothetical protein